MNTNSTTLCVVCEQVLYHHNGSSIKFNRIAHPQCASLMIKLNSCVRDGTSIQKFAQRCIKYEIEPTRKALLMELAIKNL